MMDRIIGGLVGAVLFLMLFLLTPPAQAGEWFPGETRVYAGVVYDDYLDRAPECHRSNWVGEFGVEYDVYEHGNQKVMASYQHDSCLDEFRDRGVQNGIGMRWVYTFD